MWEEDGSQQDKNTYHTKTLISVIQKNVAEVY